MLHCEVAVDQVTWTAVEFTVLVVGVGTKSGAENK